MNATDPSIDRLIVKLNERAKELNCIYRVEKVFNCPDQAVADICRGLLSVIPPGWQYPDICQVLIRLGEDIYSSPNFVDTPWVQRAAIVVQGQEIGMIEVSYLAQTPNADEGPFLQEEQELIESIADRFARHLLIQKLTRVFEKQNKTRQWQVITDMLRRTNPRLLMAVTRKMLNMLCWSGVPEAERLLESFGPAYRSAENALFSSANAPTHHPISGDFLDATKAILEIADDNLSDEEITGNIQKWISEDRSDILANVLEIPGASLQEVVSALQRFQHLVPRGLELSPQRETAFKVSLGRRFFSDQPDFIRIAKHYVTLDDYADLAQRLIIPSDSHGKLGGKAAGMVLAESILLHACGDYPILQGIRTPRTWYLASGGVRHFVHFNNLEDILAQKYKEIGQVRQEYPHVVQLFKNSPMPSDILRGLAVALDSLGDVPLIARSSSLLEDRLGAAFAGKYKSVFIANQGTKEERLEALVDAVAEVYASTFGPDPIEYRIRHQLTDLHEEMGVLIQEVVGTRVGQYYLPAFAGVAFSNNEFRWSPRIKREDGVVRLVPGLGTRAVDRVANDYPLLLAPGRPGLRVNATLAEKVRYSPKMIDVIDLNANTFQTIEIQELLRQHGHDYPLLHQLASVLQQDRLQMASPMGLDSARDSLVVTGEGLIKHTPFVEQIHTMLQVLQERLETPVDIEFAHDGEHFYLLQCRPQTYAIESAPATIPQNPDPADVLFSTHRFVSNGTTSDITHVVYVNPQRYQTLSERADLLAVGRVVGQLNQMLPPRRFTLIGPGRWGSRGDIKLGVSVTFSDIDNAAMLVEVADSSGDFMPELSFGTHFFLDLVESAIRYLPVYPDDPFSHFDERFLTESANLLPDLLPEFDHLADVVQVIDVAVSTGGRLLQIYMNADEERAVGMFTAPTTSKEATMYQDLSR